MVYSNLQKSDVSAISKHDKFLKKNNYYHIAIKLILFKVHIEYHSDNL